MKRDLLTLAALAAGIAALVFAGYGLLWLMFVVGRILFT